MLAPWKEGKKEGRKFRCLLMLCNPLDCSTPGFPVHHQLQELVQIHVHQARDTIHQASDAIYQASDAIQPFHPLSSLLLLPSVFPSIRVFSNESVLHIRWPNYWSFSFNISPYNEYSGLISFRVDWMDLLARLSRVFFNTTVQKHQFFSMQFSL